MGLFELVPRDDSCRCVHTFALLFFQERLYTQPSRLMFPLFDARRRQDFAVTQSIGFRPSASNRVAKPDFPRSETPPRNQTFPRSFRGDLGGLGPVVGQWPFGVVFSVLRSPRFHFASALIFFLAPVHGGQSNRKLCQSQKIPANTPSTTQLGPAKPKLFRGILPAQAEPHN